MPFAYYGHHKCASTWVRAITEQVLREAGYAYGIAVNPQSPNGAGPLTDYTRTFAADDLARHVTDQNLDFVSCITADDAQADAMSDARGFHVIRDPRDIIVSGYFSHRNSHTTDGLPHYAAHREQLRAVSKEEGVLLEMDFSAQCIHDIAQWTYDRPNVLEVKMENLTQHPYEGFIEIFEFLGLMSWDGAYVMSDKIKHFVAVGLNRFSQRHPMLKPLRSQIDVTGSMLLGRVYDMRFEKKAGGRQLGEADANSHYRKGVAGDWINHFTEEHIAAFNEAFGDVLVRTGYESEPWTVERFLHQKEAHGADAALSPA
jgi:hypothetical protein